MSSNPAPAGFTKPVSGTALAQTTDRASALVVGTTSLADASPPRKKKKEEENGQFSLSDKPKLGIVLIPNCTDWDTKFQQWAF